MTPPDDRIAKRLEQIRAREAELEREAADRSDDVPPPSPVVTGRREGGALRSAAFLIGVLVLAAGLLGVAVTLTRLAGDDIADAQRTGVAKVSSCVQHGPISNKGFGYWYNCTATITWDLGTVDRSTIGAVFTPTDIGTEIRVGDLGNYRTTKQIARPDASPKPWLAWIGYAAGILAFVPGLVGVLMLRELLRFRRR